MPISYRIDRERALVITEAWGVLTDEDILDHKTRLLNDPGFEPKLMELSDIRSIERLDVTQAGIKAMVQHDAANLARRAGHRVLLVVPNDLVFGMARMYELMGSRDAGGVEVFRSMEEADAWLAKRARD